MYGVNSPEKPLKFSGLTVSMHNNLCIRFWWSRLPSKLTTDAYLSHQWHPSHNLMGLLHPRSNSLFLQLLYGGHNGTWQHKLMYCILKPVQWLNMRQNIYKNYELSCTTWLKQSLFEEVKVILQAKSLLIRSKNVILVQSSCSTHLILADPSVKSSYINHVPYEAYNLVLLAQKHVHFTIYLHFKWHLTCLNFISLVTCIQLQEEEPQPADPISFTWAPPIAASVLMGR